VKMIVILMVLQKLLRMNRMKTVNSLRFCD
jgi:hypothetical protein